MGIVERSEHSRRDMADIWWRIAEDNVDAADRMLDEFLRVLKLLATQPMMGTSRDDLGRLIRTFPVGDYLLIYEPLPEGIALMRVIHGSRHLPSAIYN